MKEVKKQWIARILAAAMLLAMLPVGIMTTAKAQFRTGACGEGLTWLLDETSRVLEISGTGSMEEYTDEKHGHAAPWYGLEIETCVISSGVTRIGNAAFLNCAQLERITIPDSVTSIGESAFSGCKRLTSIALPDQVRLIDNDTFLNCTALADIKFPASLTAIDWGAFTACRALTSLTIPDGVTVLGDYAFQDCSGLTSVSIPNSVTYIWRGVFERCTSLKSVTIPNSVESIGEYAFAGCVGLTSAFIPSSVISIGNNPWSCCKGLKSLSIDAANAAYCVVDGALYTKDRQKLIAVPAGKTSVTMLDTITTIGEGACWGCSSLTSIQIPNKVTTIERYAFYGCAEMSAITIPGGVLQIGESAFQNCTDLTDVLYAGDDTAWNKTEIGTGNEALNDATIRAPGDGSTHKCAAFTDSINHWAHDAICYCVEKGYLNGVSDTLFAPNSNMTRAMAVTLLWRIEGSQTGVANPFSDVPGGTWYTDAVAWANGNGIVTGYSANKFGPNDTVTREQLATILYRYAKFQNKNPSEGGTLSKFSDASAVFDYAKGALQWAVFNELIKGRTETTLVPQGTATRAEVATLIQRFLTAQV